VPPFAQGYVKDLRVRWALEEAGLPYHATLIDAQIQASASYRQWQPFGQVPAYRDDDVEMFESGAIVLHVATKSEVLAPGDEAGRARVASWVIAALNSIEPHAQNLIHFDGECAGATWANETCANETWANETWAKQPWAKRHRTHLAAMLSDRLAALSASLGGKEYLEGRFTAGDIVMTTVLRELVDCGALAQFPNLDAYRRRCEARPAFGRALAAQMQPFRENAPA
jgi:glutathione S-transferase